jgi:L-malate glycosyltransferase
MTSFRQRIHAVHLLNDFSGSPLVFQIALDELIQQGHAVELYTATPSGNGFLSRIKSSRNHALFYRWSPNKYLTLLFFLWAQCALFFRLLFSVKKGDSVYVNTLLPFGAMWAAKFKGCHLVVHVHEVSLKPAALKSFLVWSTDKCADDVIFVSDFVRSQYQFKRPNTLVVLNKLSPLFIDRIEVEKEKYKAAPRTVLMLCSLKAYKGIYEFLEIARQLPDISFELVLNASLNEVTTWAMNNSIPSNCVCFSSQSDTHPFYARAAVLMNLSRPEEWLETFGMTILEGLAYGAFVIVPTQGAPRELIQDGLNGVAIDCRSSDEICRQIKKILR